ncbi:patatin-like phospholipase family protein [Sphingomonas profundi]|uniref:patatin-like phospholipase family protein n=1 Tax=Alterirhizorhabdus profundi TaxID=2681549 RepID=UPI0012E93DD2|nr:patatin-like phospholipase family protein [Sphingomonas profundi]
MADNEPVRRAALPLPDQVALVLQGGGALGAYQAGVYEALAGAAIEIDWVAGISIGAVNAAIIAGNPPARRVDRLRAFWDGVSGSLPSFPIWPGERMREAVHLLSAGWVAAAGIPGFFSPRLIPPVLAPAGTPGALSFYDSAPLAATLDALVDWDLLNDGPVRLSVGAVELESGNFHYFDSRRERIDARHIMASGALPPGLPPVEIDGRLWWDGGLVSNTPLSHVLDSQAGDLLVFQVDLFAAANDRPKTMMDVMSRAKEIQFSSRTRQISDQLLKLRREREAIRKVLAKLPADLAGDPDVTALAEAAREHSVNLVQLVYRANAWEGGSRDYEFSARTMGEHWSAGQAAVAQTITRSGLLASNIIDGRTAAFDLTRPE